LREVSAALGMHRCLPVAHEYSLYQGAIASDAIGEFLGRLPQSTLQCGNLLTRAPQRAANWETDARHKTVCVRRREEGELEASPEKDAERDENEPD
jgi:hypothetical protein